MTDLPGDIVEIDADDALPHWLLVDDDVVFTATLARGLTRHGHRCAVANDGTRALELARELLPDRVVLDLRLGLESGLALLPRLRAVLPDARIVVLTGFASIATAVRAMKDGADDYLPKPVLLRDLLARFAGDADGADLGPATGNETLSPRRLEWEHIQRVLVECDGNISEAARRLNLHRRTLQRKLAKRPSKR